MMNRLKALWGDAGAWFAALSTREKRLVSAAGAGVGVFVLFLLLFSLSSAAGATRRRTSEKLAKLQEVQVLAASFHDSENQRKAFEQQLSGNGIKLITYVNDRGTNAGLDIQSMNPKGDVPIGDGNILESAVELTLTDVNIRKLVDFLNSVESGNMVKVKTLRIEPRPTNDTLTAWMTLVTYRLKQGQ